MRNSLTLLNENGDTTIAWDESNDEKMIALIQKKMDEGMTFFIIKPRLFGLMPMKVKAKSVKEAVKDRQIFVKDSDFNDMMFNKGVESYKREAGEIESVGLLTKATDAVDKHLIGVTRRVGG